MLKYWILESSFTNYFQQNHLSNSKFKSAGQNSSRLMLFHPSWKNLYIKAEQKSPYPFFYPVKPFHTRGRGWNFTLNLLAVTKGCFESWLDNILTDQNLFVIKTQGLFKTLPNICYGAFWRKKNKRNSVFHYLFPGGYLGKAIYNLLFYINRRF